MPYLNDVDYSSRTFKELFFLTTFADLTLASLRINNDVFGSSSGCYSFFKRCWTDAYFGAQTSILRIYQACGQYRTIILSASTVASNQ